MKNKIILIALFLTLCLSSCRSVPIKDAPLMPNPAGPQTMPESAVTASDIFRQDVVHEVGPGETVWRISRTYGIPMTDIIQANNLGKAAQLEKGQRLVIPNAATTKAAIPLYPTRKWKYIIIHHSATDEGNAYYFNILHRRKGWNEIGYDFVIDNGTKNKADGAIEVSPRWIRQEVGAHCRASDMNSKGIGICLVGNFSKERISEKQLDSLIYLINVLRKYYRIPMSRIMGHGQVPGARTECPGKYFPWTEFRKKLENCR